MATFDRHGSAPQQYERVQCDECSTFDEEGFTVNEPDDKGTRCWTSLWSTSPEPCRKCARDADLLGRRIAPVTVATAGTVR